MVRIRHTAVISADGTRLAAYECGGGPGPVLVLCNGLGSSIGAWCYVIEAFSPRHRIVGWDYRGLFKSGPPAPGTNCAIVTQVQDLRAVLKHFEVDKGVLVGWSMGVQVALEAWRHIPHNVLGLVLISGASGHVAVAVGPRRHTAYTDARLALKIIRDIGAASPALEAALFLKLTAEFLLLPADRLLATLDALLVHSAEDLLATITVPALVVTGDRDHVTPSVHSERMVQAMADAELFVVPHGSHFTPLEFPELVNLRLHRWLHERLGVAGPAARWP